MKVYVLTEGCYSAYHIIGVTLDEEQAKIAGLFEKINTLITLHQRKCFGFKNVGIFMKDLVSDKKLGSKTYFNTLYDTLLRGGLSFYDRNNEF